MTKKAAKPAAATAAAAAAAPSTSTSTTTPAAKPSSPSTSTMAKPSSPASPAGARLLLPLLVVALAAVAQAFRATPPATRARWLAQVGLSSLAPHLGASSSMVGGAPQPNSQRASTEATPVSAKVEVPTHHALYPANGSPTGVFNQPASAAPASVVFTLAGNGDGTSVGVRVDSADFSDVDAVISKHCCALTNNTHAPQLCAPGSGARLINDAGVRLLSFADVEPNQRVYCVPQGVHFVWPLVRVGNVVYPKNVVGPHPDKPIKMTQMTDQPRVFTVDNFVSPAEIEELLENNRDRLTPSEVGFAGWQDDTRTSSTSWDFTSPAALAIQTRTFQLLGMDPDPKLADAMQVLRYTSDGYKGKGEWYKPHVDWFSADGYDGSDPKVNNGTNRFATMFLYLSNVEEGGHTVFPLSTTHEGYDGRKIVHDGTVNTAGYINTAEARAACNVSATSALRVAPIAGNAVLFYSQGPDGTLDPWSLHGGCPPIKGVKWSAIVWIWNRIRPEKSAAKDKPPPGAKSQGSSAPGAMHVSFRNSFTHEVGVFWDANVPTDISKTDYDKVFAKMPTRFHHQFDVPPQHFREVNTFDKHTFIAIDKVTNKVVWKKMMDASELSGMGTEAEPEVIHIA